MKCEKSGEITAFLKGEVAEAEREPLRLHFERCFLCAAELEKFDRVRKALGRLEGIAPSPGFQWRVREAFLRAHPEFLERPHPEPLTFWGSLRSSFAFVPAWAISITAHVLLIALAAILIFVPKSPEEEMEEWAVRAKPREPVGIPPEFDRPAGKGSKPDWIGKVPVADPEPEDYPPAGEGIDFVVPAPVPRLPVREEKIDLKLWKDRISRDRRLLAFFEGRGLDTQRDALRAKGTRKPIRAALEWLARNQQADGRWPAPAIRVEGGEETSYGVGVTGLALLAFLGEGHTGQAGGHAAKIRKGLDALLVQQRVSGLLGPERGNSMYNHGIAALALLEASMMTHDEVLDAAAAAAVNFIVASQNETGGWGYVSRAPENDTSVTGWQVMVLRLAKLTGNQGVIPSLVQAHRRLELMTDFEGKVGYRMRLQYPNGYAALTAVGMFAHLMSTHTPDPELMGRQARLLLEQSALPGNMMDNDLYFGTFGSLALHQHGGEAWTQWFEPLREKLLRAQLPDGAWPSDFDRWHGYGGQVYTTAMATLILETPLRYPRLFE